ncbi:AraC family transcriptional regulator [Bacteroides sp. 51]|uniref:helix-turn-helix domain-containing protein n=1 Tax=Bacteroides sp. 51 TaxID=2302938 RepID=UPI0013D2B5CB|nr:helix-turn-helix transcriptional regulator [Bacteroides sp. 51]NDV83335.1 AraC family transcriptional regulator [Bacteroides sp. 51]
MPKLLYAQEHFACQNYEKGKNATLEILNIPKGKKIERTLHDTEIVFMLGGRFTLSYAKILNMEVNPGVIMLFPPGSQVRAESIEDTRLIICRIRGILQLCECVSMTQIYNSRDKNIKEEFHTLTINDRIYKFVELMQECVDDGLKCGYYFETKMKELFFLLRAYYTKEELIQFFSPLLSHNSRFMNLMYQNRNARSVNELIDISMYSESGFKKQFNKVFGTSASDWLRDQKASLVYNDLIGSDLSIKELADKYNFSSVSSFTTFCQSKFGLPPGQIRTRKAEKVIMQKSS